MGVLILPFVGVYTINLTDVQYVRPVLGILFTLIVFMQNVRIPGLTIICAAGHYKETRYQAILEAVINITVSLGLVWKFGMAGVLLGTVCSYGYRSFEIVFYTCLLYTSDAADEEDSVDLVGRRIIKKRKRKKKKDKKLC